MEIKKQGSEDLIVDIEGAVLQVVESLYDAGDLEAAIIATVHRMKDGSVANVWLKNRLGIKKVLDERLLPGEPSAEMLVGETMRLSETSLEPFGVTGIRENLVKIGLFNTAESLVLSSHTEEN